MRKKINITVATGMQEMGGVATVLNVLSRGFNDNWNMRHITTHTNHTYWFGLNKIFLFLFSIIKLSYYLTFFNVGIVHIHMASRGSYKRKSVIIRIAKLFRAKTILHLHGAEFQEFYNNECSFKKQAHIRKTFDLADAVIVLSTQWHSWMKTIVGDPTKVHVIYNAVDTLDLNRSNIDQGRILFLGRLGERKGVKDLIDAFAIVLTEYPDSRLTLGGDGDVATFKQQVKNLGISNSVDFLGWVAGEQKKIWLSKADVYCLPSYNEGFPMGVLEAMSANIPVVASTAGGIPDAIEDSVDGLLIEAGDVEMLATHLKTMISNRDLNAAYSASAKKKFINNFSKQAVFPELDKIYTELMSK
ncbi:Glycosyl transferases group 1 [Vibrio sp. B1REV9]|uniref:glycosyltransferase family 4 protein n=1 Tax=Vibrio sp. B1REV9 TaxID=2751179 RepID=UPI001AF45739|nr:glycosyltransferase family 4 protein [Vibrio sp. B1REV9]CAE6928133.1 Glycosyl transferases group 1 [Vibrio sp. B1REV9]